MFQMATLTGEAALNLSQIYLDQARQQKESHQLEQALVLCNQAKVTLESEALNRKLTLSEGKHLLKSAYRPQTEADQRLRERLAHVYFERAQIKKQLGESDQARKDYEKAQKLGHPQAEIQLQALPPFQGLSSHDSQLTHSLSSSTIAFPLPDQSAIEKKSDLVNYLFEKTLSTLKSLDLSATSPSLFLVYAHDTQTQEKADATTSKYLIHKLSEIRSNLYSDQTPMGQSPKGLEGAQPDAGKIEDILTNQLCLLPTCVRKNIEPVDKVIVCCSEVLGNYLKRWGQDRQYYEAYRTELEEVYHKAREQQNEQAIREVLKKFSQNEPYKAGFHHVLTEIAFLQIRAKEWKERHGIIPVSLTKDSYEQCLKDFVSTTTVRIEDMPRFEAQAQQGREIYPDQGRHWVLFKLIERLFVHHSEVNTFLNKFWDGYSSFIAQLKGAPSAPEALKFAKVLDDIFDEVRADLHIKLAFTVQQEQKKLQTLNADPRSALKNQYFDALKQDETFKETLQLYVAPHGKASLDSEEPLLSKVEAFLKSNKKVLLLLGDSGAGKSTFNRCLEKQLWDKKKEGDAIPLFISLPSIDKPEDNLIEKALKKRGLSEFQIQSLKKEKQKFVFILDGYDEIRQTQNLYLRNRINQPEGWPGQMVISCRSEYLGHDYRSRFQPNPNQPDDPSFQEVVIMPFSETERDEYLEKYISLNQTGWAAQQYKEALEQPHLKALVGNPFLLRVVLESLPYLENEGKMPTTAQLRMDLYNQFVKQWFERNQQRLSEQDLTGGERRSLEIYPMTASSSTASDF